MRHGESESDRLGIINSDPGKPYRLTATGMEQSAESIRQSTLSELGSRVLIYCSQFPRTKQTALIASQLLDADLPTVNKLLNERNFGLLEGESVANYARVWDADKAVGAIASGVERLRQDKVELPTVVAQRAARLVAIAEYRHDKQDILFVSHDDPLQIMQAIASGVQPTRHRDLPPFEPAEIRQVANS